MPYEYTEGSVEDRITDYDELIGRAEDMLRNAVDFLGNTTNANARVRMEELIEKMEGDISRYRRARDKQKGFELETSR